jgi:outer membrane receptor protein involved in Fe transport
LSTGIHTRQSFADRTQQAFSPRVSAVVRITGNLSLSSSYTEGFRQPTLNELYRAFRVGDVLTNANAALTAERARTFEAAGTFAARGERMRLRAGFFASLVRDPVSNVTISITPTLITRQRRNMGRVLSRGFELDAESRLTKGVSLTGGYLYVDSRVTSFPADPSLVGRRLPQIPRHKLTLSAIYSRPETATISAQLRAASSQFDDDRNQFPLKGFYTLDIYASRRITDNIAVFAAVENAFDRRIEAGRTPVLTLASPRTARLGVRLQFGRK